MKRTVVNHFWIAGDMLFYLPQGSTQEVFRLAGNSKDASVFARGMAENVKAFIERRMVPAIGQVSLQLKIEAADSTPGLFVVHGIQEVEVDSET